MKKQDQSDDEDLDQYLDSCIAQNTKQAEEEESKLEIESELVVQVYQERLAYM